jgi:hypothetical protein
VSAARLFSTLQSRPGHALVIGDDAAAAEAFLEPIDAQLVCQRRLMLRGAGLDPDSMILALAADIRGPHRPRSVEAILSMVATEARAAGLPILIIITGAEEAGAAALERLATLIESVPDARAAVRVVLLGGPRLEEVLSEPQAEKLAARVLATVRAPSPGARRWVFPLLRPPGSSSWQDIAQWVAGAVVALVGVIMLLTPWVGREGTGPPAMDVATNDAGTNAAAPGVAVEPPAVAEQPPATEPPAAAEAAADEEPDAVAQPPAPPPAATPPPPAAVEPPAAATPPSEAPQASSPLPPPVAATPRRPPALARTLQVGAFRNADNARALAATLSARFPDVRVVTATRDGLLFHCVRLGGFADERALAARADALRAAGYPVIRQGGLRPPSPRGNSRVEPGSPGR